MSRSLRAITPVTIISRGLLVGGLLYSPLLLAQEGGITLFNTVQTATGQDYNVKIEILILMTLLGLLPIMMLMMTCFTRFIIVLAILRQALGLQQSPPNKVLTGIARAACSWLASSPSP